MTVSTFKRPGRGIFYVLSILVLIRLTDTQTAQSLHPGGKYYPQDTNQQQMPRPASHDSDVRIAAGNHSEFDEAW